MPYAVWIELTDPAPGDDDETVRADIPRLIVQLIGFRDGALVGIAVDTESAEAAIQAGTALARHLSSAAPVLLDWRLETLRAERLREPADDGQWLPALATSASVHLPAAAHLSPHGLRRAAARRLISTSQLG